MKILIVDDSTAMRMIIRRTLRQAGFGDCECIEAEDGAKALEMVRNDPPDFVLADWNMPEMNGIELLQALRAENIEIPFGFVTSEGTDAMREKAANAGALFLLAKPFSADDMTDVLGVHLK